MMPIDFNVKCSTFSFLFQEELNVSIARIGGTPPHPIFRRVLLIGAATMAAVVAKERTGTATMVGTAVAQTAGTMLFYNFLIFFSF